MILYTFFHVIYSWLSFCLLFICFRCIYYRVKRNILVSLLKFYWICFILLSRKLQNSFVLHWLIYLCLPSWYPPQVLIFPDSYKSLMHLPVLITTSRLNISRQLPIIKVFVLIFNLILMQLFSFELFVTRASGCIPVDFHYQLWFSYT
jgi:hypothetical protein